MSKIKDKETYLKQFPKASKWLNQCLICHTVGYKPELPDKIYPGFLAENIRSMFSSLAVNEISICDECSIHWKEK
jgi:hypothetical protein